MGVCFEALFVILNIVYLVNARIPKLDGRIVGGTNASILEFPYQVSLRRYSQHICGASIFHYSYALTAAHCVYGGSASQYSIRAGSDYVNKDGKRIKVCTIHYHEKYNPDTMDNDIAILTLCTPLTFTEKILPVALPEVGEAVADGISAVISGWGYEKESGSVQPILKKVIVPIISQIACQSRYISSATITNNMICAGLIGTGGKDACQGDSGGPLRANGKLMGIVSWGYGCARPQYPGVYTKVSNYRSWIKQITLY
ncbi:hypothetical protein NQ318_022825 [Aromia moschata]|uniref:Peptidase S1 domain-containing protein n=1 Tax=Aromia moschata TaxID=1265417 RepID=A0AAV8XV84_9CUCU|nr:hypothetical protein NQ318_022825 [Aromia moschata]